MRSADENVIHDLASRFADSINLRDRDAFAGLWWEEGVWELTEPYPMLARGIGEVLLMYDRLMADWTFFVQLVHSGVVNRNHHFAQARWTMQEVARSDTKHRSYRNLAIYDDLIEQRKSEWRFIQRRYCYVWHDDAAIAGRAFPLPDDFGMLRGGANGVR